MLELGKMVYVDCENLNEDPEYVGLGVQSANGFIGNMRQATRVQWAEVAEKALGRVPGGGQHSTMKKKRCRARIPVSWRLCMTSSAQKYVTSPNCKSNLFLFFLSVHCHLDLRGNNVSAGS
jgi:hypothetical protein